MGRLFIASFFTVTLLFSFVFAVIILIFLHTDTLITAFVVIILVNNFLFLTFAPSMIDGMNKFFHNMEFISKDDFKKRYPDVAELIEQVSFEYHFPFPRIGIIPDKNPTAFTYGFSRFSARIVLTEGIFHFLTPREVKAVVAHELGHIVHRDFIVMMLANTFLQILYEIYDVLRRARGRKSGAAKFIALIAYVLYSVGTYFLLYLSRTREYFADTFSAKITDPNDLSNALIKIAYCIVSVQDTERSQRLLYATRSLGIIDVSYAHRYGLVPFMISRDNRDLAQALLFDTADSHSEFLERHLPDLHDITSYMTDDTIRVLSELMVFDKINPWSKIVEFTSTHPLMGHRIGYLADIAHRQGSMFLFDIDSAILRMNIDFSRLWHRFFIDLFVLLLPFVFVLCVYFFLPYPFLPMVFALGLLLQIPYIFPSGETVATCVLDLMRNPYASFVRGQPVLLSGQVVGRGIPGFTLCEDVMYQDATGVIFLDYRSALGFLGNIVFAVDRYPMLLGVPSRAVGWFYRSLSSRVLLKYIQTETSTVRSHPILWRFFVSFLLIFVSFYWYFLSRGYSLADFM